MSDANKLDLKEHSSTGASGSSGKSPSGKSEGKMKKFRLQIFSRFRSKEPEPQPQPYRRRTSSVGTEDEGLAKKKSTLAKYPIESEPKSAPNL